MPEHVQHKGIQFNVLVVAHAVISGNGRNANFDLFGVFCACSDTADAEMDWRRALSWSILIDSFPALFA